MKPTQSMCFMMVFCLAYSSALPATCCMLISCLSYSSTPKMEVVWSSETSADFQQTTWRYISEDGTFYEHRCENLKPYIQAYLLMELSPSWEAANSEATPELPSILWNPKVHYHAHKSPPLVPPLSHIDPVYTIPFHLSKIYFNIVHPPTSWSS
jgi:hypothetical protein